ncbi:MAG: hypothetical protein U9P14_10535 [Gemmatimonadota bacterium]|nr:hypothetical protein [Gemmatimonadota bacterium]
MFYLLKAGLHIAVVVCLVPVGTATVRAEAREDSPRVGYEYWIPNSETDSAGQHGIHFKRFINGSAHMPAYPFSFQRWDEPQLDELNRRLGIDELVDGAGSELETAARIAHKVCNLWAHHWPVEYPLWNAHDILDRIDRGEQLWCTYKQLVTMQCLASLGIYSRIVPCNWHHSLEYWDNDYAKWVVMDAWTANYFRKDGIPLGALELHRLSRATGNVKGAGVWEININPNRWFPDRVQDSVSAETSCYSHIRYIPRNDFLSAPLAPKPAGGPEDYLSSNDQINDPIQSGLEHVIWWQPGDAPALVGWSVRYEQDFNFPLGEVEVSLHRPITREGVLDVSLATHTPEFDSYYRRLDSGDWTPCGSRLLWELEDGINSLELKSRNKWGRFGPTAVIELEYRPEELRAPMVETIEIPNPGFEEAGDSKNFRSGSPPAANWAMIIRNDYQKPDAFGLVGDNPHSGGYCYGITLNRNGIWGKLVSGSFRVNQASDVNLRVWLRADRPNSPVTVFIADATLGGPGRQNVYKARYNVGTEWAEFVLKARLSARTTSLKAGIQVVRGTVWADDFSITEDARAELPW